MSFTEKPNFTIKELIYVVMAAISFGIAYANIKQELQRNNEIATIRMEQLQRSVEILYSQQKATDLQLRKLELDVARDLKSIREE